MAKKNNRCCYIKLLLIPGYGQGIALATGERTALGQMMKKMVVFQNVKIATYVAIRRALNWIGAITIVVSIAVISVSVILRGYSWTAVLILALVQIIASMPDILYSTIVVSIDYTILVNLYFVTNIVSFFFLFRKNTSLN